jgi:hypothetical protein
LPATLPLVCGPGSAKNGKASHASQTIKEVFLEEVDICSIFSGRLHRPAPSDDPAPLLPYYAGEYGASEFVVGLLAASYAFAQFLPPFLAACPIATAGAPC